jgi:hypothetical protein
MTKRLQNYADRLVIEYPGVPRQLIERVCFAVFSYHHRETQILVDAIKDVLSADWGNETVEATNKLHDAFEKYRSQGDGT